MSVGNGTGQGQGQGLAEQTRAINTSLPACTLWLPPHHTYVDTMPASLLLLGM